MDGGGCPRRGCGWVSHPMGELWRLMAVMWLCCGVSHSRDSQLSSQMIRLTRNAGSLGQQDGHIRCVRGDCHRSCKQNGATFFTAVTVSQTFHDKCSCPRNPSVSWCVVLSGFLVKTIKIQRHKHVSNVFDCSLFSVFDIRV